MKKIKQILVDGQGWVYANKTLLSVGRTPDKDVYTNNPPIELFTKNGEMAPVDWYRYGNREYNGKYVIAVEYYEEEVDSN